MNATARRRFDMITVKLRSLPKDVTLELCVSNFPWKKPKEELKGIKFEGFPRTVVPSKEEMSTMPKILLGVRAAILLPGPLAKELVPPAFRKKWPGFEVFKSKLTGQLIFAGMLARRTGPHARGWPLGLRSLPALAFTAHGIVDDKEIQNDPSSTLWPSEKVRDVGCQNPSSSTGQSNTAESLKRRSLARGLSQIDCNENPIAEQFSFPLPETGTKDSSRSTLHRMRDHLMDLSPFLAPVLAITLAMFRKVKLLLCSGNSGTRIKPRNGTDQCRLTTG